MKNNKKVITAIMVCVILLVFDSVAVFATSGKPGISADSYYRTGLDLERKGEFETAVKYYESAVRGGSTQAMVRLGDMYVKGNGVTSDLNKAYTLFNQACDKKDPDGVAGFGDIYKEIKDYKNALACYQAAAEYGSIAALNKLGGLYYYGYGVTKDYTTALKYFKQAADKGNPDAVRNIGLLYEMGEGVKMNYDTAFSYFSRAETAGLYRAAVDIARLYKNGNKDYKTALSYYEKAVKSGYVPAMVMMGNMYLSGKDILKQDTAMAKKYYAMAAQKGNAEALDNLGVIAESEKDYKNAAGLYQSAANKNNASGLYHLACCYDQGMGTVRDNKTAAAYFQKAAELGNAEAMNIVGCMYANGNGVNRDPAKAREWLKRSADAGNKKAAENLAVLDRNTNTSKPASNGNSGSGDITKKDVEKASAKLADISEKAAAFEELADAIDSEGLSSAAATIKKWSNAGAKAADLISLFMK